MASNDYISKHSGKEVDDAVDKIPKTNPATQSAIVVNRFGRNSTYKSISSLTIDAPIENIVSQTSTNPVSNSAITKEINKKITMPANGSDGQFLFKDNDEIVWKTMIGGADGASAYDIWVANGGTGSMSDFLNSLIGPVGPVGPTGPTGIDGVPGGAGGRGAQGIKGDKGETGVEGAKGDSGDKGQQGEKGDQGKPGEQGAVGESGEPGEQGAVGESGEPGEPGEKGDDGEQGEPGSEGEKGPAGTKKGEPGPEGEKGEDGEPGPEGEQGEPGPEGEKGEDGTDAPTITSGQFVESPDHTKTPDKIELTLSNGEKIYIELESMLDSSTGLFGTNNLSTFAPNKNNQIAGWNGIQVETSTSATDGVWLYFVGGTDWDALINNYTAAKNHLVLIVPNGITQIRGGSSLGVFALVNYNNKLSKVILPNSIVYLYKNAFLNYKGAIDYNGSVASFSAIANKIAGWASNCTATIVACNNGNYTITDADRKTT